MSCMAAEPLPKVDPPMITLDKLQSLLNHASTLSTAVCVNPSSLFLHMHMHCPQAYSQPPQVYFSRKLCNFANVFYNPRLNGKIDRVTVYGGNNIGCRFIDPALKLLCNKTLFGDSPLQRIACFKVDRKIVVAKLMIQSKKTNKRFAQHVELHMALSSESDSLY